MIDLSAIAEWRHHAPWALSEQIEQDLVLSRALVELFRQPILAEELAFRGGTALHKLHLRPAGRYSEDLDFVQVRGVPLGAVLTAIRGALDPWLGRAKYKAGEGRATLLYRFVSEGAEAVPMRLKVEINTREHFAVLPLRRTRFTVESRWFRGSAEIPTFAPEELLGTKLRALYQRRKGRDLFDLDTALDRLPDLDVDTVVRCFHEYMAFGETPVSRAEFEANLAAKRVDGTFLTDVPPLLARAAAGWDGERGLDRVLRTFVARLPGEPWAGEEAR
jgi:predicted nucleotidyltransferase component of viral defense system